MTEAELRELVLPLAEGVMFCILVTGVFQYLIYLLQTVFGFLELRRRHQLRRSLHLWERRDPLLPPVSIIVPAFNESALIADAVQSFLAQDYGAFEVIIVDDGSTDDTFAILSEAHDLVEIEKEPDSGITHAPILSVHVSRNVPNLTVVRKRNGGRADAMNAGLAVAHSPLFCAVDADSVLEPDALHRCVQPFLEDPDRVIGVGGGLRVSNGAFIRFGRIFGVRLPRRLLPLVQTLEYFRSFLMARLSWSRFNVVLVVSGAFGVFSRRAVRAVGGYTTNSAGEDMDLVFKLHRHMRKQDRDYEITYLAEPACWTDVPETLGELADQRIRWQRGALEVFVANIGMLLRPRYARVAWFGLLHLFFMDVVSPVVEVLGYMLIPVLLILGLVNEPFALALVAVVFGYGFFISMLAIVMEEIELRRVPTTRGLIALAFIAVIENLGYRQINNVFRVIGTLKHLTGVRGWSNSR